MELRKLPDGTTTYNVEEYLDTWHDLAKLIEEKFNLTVVAFDPGIMFSDNKTQATISLPIWFIKRLHKVFEED